MLKKNLLLALTEVYTQEIGADELFSPCAIVLARISRTSLCKTQLVHPALRYLCPRAIFEADWLYSPFTVMEPCPRVFTAFSINLNSCPADQLKHTTTKKTPKNTTISSLQLGRQTGLWYHSSFCAPTLGVPTVSNAKHVAMLFLMGRSRRQLPWELQHKHGGVWWLARWMPSPF